VTDMVRRLRARAAAEDDRGSATVWMIGVVVCAFLMLALVLDGGVMLRARSDAYAAASAAARAGAQQLDPVAAVDGVAVLDPVAANRAALDYLTADGLTGTVTIVGDTVTVNVTSTAHLQLTTALGADATKFNAMASAQAVKVNP
jgi:Flp pilus assembly protein TadG